MITVDRAQNMTDNPIQPKAAVTTTDGSAAVSLEDQLREAQTAATIGTLAAGIARELNNSVGSGESLAGRPAFTTIFPELR